MSHAGPISRNCRSLKNDGFLPSTSCPANWNTQAKTNIAPAIHSSLIVTFVSISRMMAIAIALNLALRRIELHFARWQME